MISVLKIKNYALIKESEITFSSGLNVISGETGAGKSILLGALNFVLGGKADKSLIRNGENLLRVEIVLNDLSKQTIALLEEYGIETDDQLIISRSIKIDGKSDARINGQMVTQNMLKNIGSSLIEVTGQFENSALLKQKNHLEILDYFLDDNNLAIKESILINLKKLREINASLKNNFVDDYEKARRIELLEYQINEIENASLAKDEQEELEARKLKLQSAEKINNALTSAIENLNNNYFNISSCLKSCYQSLSAIDRFDNAYSVLMERLENIRLEAEDILEELSSSRNELYFNENEINKIEDRLDLIKSLKKKYGNSVEEIEKFLNTAKDELYYINNVTEINEKLLKDKQDLLKKLSYQCNELSTARRKTAKFLEQKIISELKELAMKNSILKVNFINTSKEIYDETQISNNGCDDVEFLFSANLGEPLKPLSKVISGGEMNRFMLSYKNVIANRDNISTLIFDEIDTGISGVIGQAVANKMASISLTHQVIAISHLPQIVAMADENIQVKKFESNGETLSSATILDENCKIKEIARSAGASTESQISLLNAKEMLANSINFKQNLRAK